MTDQVSLLRLYFSLQKIGDMKGKNGHDITIVNTDEVEMQNPLRIAVIDNTVYMRNQPAELPFLAPC